MCYIRAKRIYSFAPINIIMNVCFVSMSAYGYLNKDFDYTGGGGAQRQLSMIGKGLSDKLTIHFIVGDYGQPEFEITNGVSIHKLYSIDDDPGYHTRIKQLYMLFNKIREIDPDICISRGKSRKSAVVFLISNVIGCEYVFHVANDTDLQQKNGDGYRLTNFMFPHILKNSSAIVSQTEKQSNILKEQFGVSSTVIPNCYHLSNDNLPSGNGDYFLWVGQINQQQKRPHLYLDIAKQLPEYEFVLVGPLGSNEKYNKKILDRVSKLDNSTYVGKVNPREIHEYYKKSITVINTSEFEGFPNTFLEAWRVETPVIGLDIDPNRFITTDFDLFADGDLYKLISLADELAKENSLRHKVGSESRKRFEKNYSLDKVISDYHKLINCLL